MARGGQVSKGSWNMETRKEASPSDTFPRTVSEEGMRYLEGVDWSEIWKTMTIQDDDVFDNEIEAQEEQSRTMMIMSDDYEDNEHDHSEDEVGCKDERRIPRESGWSQGPQNEEYIAHSGGHRPIRSWSVIPEKHDGSRGQNNLRTRTRWSVMPQKFDERRKENNLPTRTHSSALPRQYARQYGEGRGENKLRTRTRSSVIPQYGESPGQSNRPTRTHSSDIPHRYDESHRRSNLRTRTRWSVIPQQFVERREENNIQYNSYVDPQQHNESRLENNRLTRAHSSVVPQQYAQQHDEGGGQYTLPTRTRCSVISRQYDERRGENNLITGTHSSVIPQQHDGNHGQRNLPTRTRWSVISRQYDERRGENNLITGTHSSVIPQQHDGNPGQRNLPTRTRWSVIPQQYDESRLENNRQVRTHSSVIPQLYVESRRQNNRSLSLELFTEERLNGFNCQRSESTDTRTRRTNSRRTERVIDHDEDKWKQSSGLICRICFSEEVLLLRNCCSFPICQFCFDKCLTTQIDEGKVKIECPNYECRSVVPLEEIIQIVDTDRRIKLERRATKTLRRKGFKACPQCNAITVASDTLLRRAKQERSTFKVTCPVCELEWCYDCETPWHSQSTCKNVKSNDKLFKEWTKRYSDSEKSEKNARKCPKCKVYIQKNTGCDHMTCRWCGTKFCYKCGRRIGSSPHRCYDFLPNLNTGKGTIFLMVILAPLAIPAIVAVAAVSLPILIGYGGYKLVKAVRRRPAARTQRS